MTRSTASYPLHPASASMASSYSSPSPYPRGRSAVSSDEPPAAVRPAEPFSHESKCFILADMGRNAPSENKVCGECAARLGPHERRHTVQVLFGPGCKICDLKVSEPESFTKPFIQFLIENPTIFHAVDYFKGKMNAVGFTEVSRPQRGGPKPQQGAHRG